MEYCLAIKRIQSCLSHNMDGSGGYCAEWSKSNEKDKYHFTYMLELKEKINKQNRNKLIDTEHFDGCQMESGLGG